MHLHCGQLHMVLEPEAGGRCDGVFWHVPGQDVPIALLRPQQAQADDVLHSACFALVPYSNRMFDGLLRTGTGSITLPPNLARLPHPVHGLGWRSAWAVIGHSDNHAQMQYTHPGDAHWPFAHSAVQKVTVGESSLLWEMSARNEAALPMPFGLGWHPCFEIDAATCVQWDATHAWTRDDVGRPLERNHTHDHLSFDFRRPRRAQDMVINHCLDGWTGPVTITHPTHGLRLQMTASKDLRHLVVYRTMDQPWLCIEPVSHATGALGLSELFQARYGARMLAPGATAHAWMRIEVTLPPINKFPKEPV